MTHELFLDEVARFRAELDKASGWSDLRLLWGRHISPYQLASRDPLANEYRDEILDLYKKMTSSTYELSNELTSTKVPAADFVRGYPWMTNDLGTAAAEIVKVVQAFRVMQAFAPNAKRLVEFGSGWANLSIALAQIGRDVTAIDIDQGFIDRTKKLAERQDLTIQTMTADFLTAARTLRNNFDAVIFQSSFHHCLDFYELLRILRSSALTPNGRIFFFSEPIFPNYSFPWGLRTDGESVWAITSNKWCELGFDRDFFVSLMHCHGFFGTATGAIPNVIGDAWVATPVEIGLDFSEWALPTYHEETFHRAGGDGQGRFLRNLSILPVPRRRRAVLTFMNFSSVSLSAGLVSGVAVESITVEPGAKAQVVLDGLTDEISISCDTFIPNKLSRNGDSRQVGLSLIHVQFS